MTSLYCLETRKTKRLSIFDVSKKNIWHYKQAKLSLIAKDLEVYGVSEDISYKILMARGVFKWFAVRRHIIKLKNRWKDRIRRILNQVIVAKKNRNIVKYHFWKGYLKGYEECRADIRVLCHSDRWVVPDNDQKAISWFKNQ